MSTWADSRHHSNVVIYSDRHCWQCVANNVGRVSAPLTNGPTCRRTLSGRRPTITPVSCGAALKMISRPRLPHKRRCRTVWKWIFNLHCGTPILRPYYDFVYWLARHLYVYWLVFINWLHIRSSEYWHYFVELLITEHRSQHEVKGRCANC